MHWLGKQICFVFFLCPVWGHDVVSSRAADSLSGSLQCPLFDSCECVDQTCVSLFLILNFGIQRGERKKEKRKKELLLRVLRF